ncbi:MAG: hypothetical protein JOZ81_11360, partial [Chloroflexi bacterium]|nr:hypothetical protein [Chloroflexota bacterium]
MSTEIAVPPTLTERSAVENLSRARQEPAWLLELRLRAFDAFSAMPMPDQRTEGWRRTSLRGLDLNALRFDSEPGRATASSAPSGVTVLDFSDALRDARYEQLLREHFGRIVPPEYDKFTALHYAFFNA